MITKTVAAIATYTAERKTPASSDASHEVARPAADDGGETATEQPGVILLAEDEETIRRLLARALRRHGFTVVEAEDGVQALEKAELHQPDLVLVDVRMPHLDGFAVVRELKSKHAADLPVLVLSGLDEPEDRVQAFEAGADDFIPKPVYMKELLKRVDAFERQRRAYIELQAANERADSLRVFSAEAAALLAHDLNNGLSIANANLQFLDEVLELAGEPHDALAASSRALRRMMGLVRNFVDISRLEDAAIQPQRATVNIAELLETAALIHDTKRKPEDKGIVVRCDADLQANIDPVLIERVIHNLLNNATRYVSAGGYIGLQARWTDHNEQSHLEITVGNTGPSIPESIRDSIFSKYGMGKDGKSQRGMGLYFCALACNAHGGSISLTEHPEFPTNFCLLLPREELDPATDTQ